MMVFTEVCGHHVSKATAVNCIKAGQPLSTASYADIPFDALVIMLVCATLVMNCMKHLSFVVSRTLRLRKSLLVFGMRKPKRHMSKRAVAVS